MPWPYEEEEEESVKEVTENQTPAGCNCDCQEIRPTGTPAWTSTSTTPSTPISPYQDCMPGQCLCHVLRQEHLSVPSEVHTN